MDQVGRAIELQHNSIVGPVKQKAMLT